MQLERLDAGEQLADELHAAVSRALVTRMSSQLLSYVLVDCRRAYEKHAGDSSLRSCSGGTQRANGKVEGGESLLI